MTIACAACCRMVGRSASSGNSSAHLPTALSCQRRFFSSSVPLSGPRLDQFIKQVLHAALPNVVHVALASRGYRIFTTNFDTCFEAAGALRTRHLHGYILRPETLQNQLYRLGNPSAGVAELVDARDLKTPFQWSAASIPAARTTSCTKKSLDCARLLRLATWQGAKI